MQGRAVDAPTCPVRVGALDGLRGLAVGAVLLYHSQFGFARGRYLGVSLFFTLSGFLITCLLVTKPSEQPRVRLRSFWGRRARRLLPAAALALAAVLIYGATMASADQLRSLRGDMLATLGYVGNWRFYFSGQNYAQLFSAPSPVLHFWSLAIEEQFYLVFPLVVAFVAWASRGRRYVLGGRHEPSLVPERSAQPRLRRCHECPARRRALFGYGRARRGALAHADHARRRARVAVDLSSADRTTCDESCVAPRSK